MAETANPTAILCTHCGATAGNNPIVESDGLFCCEGCKTVYHILNANGLCDYYTLDPKAAISLNNLEKSSWSLEELNLMESSFTLFNGDEKKIVLFYIPAMHCASCIWLLERLVQLDKGIYDSRTDFVKKQLKISYDPRKTSFGNIVLLLRSLGYEPPLMPEEEHKAEKKLSRNLLIKLGVAGFCAGNIMMFSFPQYLGLDAQQEREFGRLFDGINAALSIPLIFLCASDYFRSLWNWVRFKDISVKVPLAIGIGMLWLRSIYEVSSNTGPGYFDSLAGLIFFLLIGAWLQDRTFDALRFGEKARKFFPLVAKTLVQGKTVPKKVVELTAGDRVVLGHGEIIPADGILMGSEAFIDYSFATGESTPILKVAGEILLGGGKNAGGRAEMEVIRPFDNSKLSEIWKTNDESKVKGSKVLSFEAEISRYFIVGTLAVALGALVFWIPQNSAKAWFAFTAVLMVACPCALALAPPFAYNIAANYMARFGLFLRKPEVVGSIGDATTMVFDKTGTLTEAESVEVVLPENLNAKEKSVLKTITLQSNHPYSQAIANALEDYEGVECTLFKEFVGKGSFAECDDHLIKLGSAGWVGCEDVHEKKETEEKKIYFSIDGKIYEPISVRNIYRKNLSQTFGELNDANMEMFVASGDSEAERERLQQLAPGMISNMYFHQSPSEKVSIIKRLQGRGKVIMVGDGLNDAAALKAGDVGMVVAAGTNNFTPEADAILLKDNFYQLPDHILLARKANRVVKETFAVSLTYNFIALGFAFAGKMSPLLAAILMPCSSIALMLYAWGRTKYIVYRKEKQ